MGALTQCTGQKQKDFVLGKWGFHIGDLHTKARMVTSLLVAGLLGKVVQCIRVPINSKEYASKKVHIQGKGKGHRKSKGSGRGGGGRRR